MKNIQEKAKEMTREEFLKYADFEELCPHNFGLNDDSENKCDDGDSLDICHRCLNEATGDVKFKGEGEK